MILAAYLRKAAGAVLGERPGSRGPQHARRCFCFRPGGALRRSRGIVLLGVDSSTLPLGT